MRALESFRDWAQLLDHAKAGYVLFYLAPMDINPVRVVATIRKDGQLRVMAPLTDSDPFTADQEHLYRFRRYASRRTTAQV